MKKNFETAPEWARERALCKREILVLGASFVEANEKDLGRDRAVRRFIHQFNGGQIGEDLRVKLRLRRLKRSTFYLWEKILNTEGLSGLLEGYGRNGSRIDGSVREIIEKLVWSNHLCHFIDVFRDLTQMLPKRECPSYFQVRSFVTQFKRENWASLVLKHEGQRGLRDRNLSVVIGKSDGDLSEPCERWQLDTTLADLFNERSLDDVLVETSDGKRSKIIGVADMFSRMIRFFVVDVESGRAVGAAIKDCIMSWGIPKEIVIDNGGPFKNRRIKGFLNKIGTKLRVCDPGRGDQKGIIERAFRTVTDEVFRRLPGYSGNNLNTRPHVIKVQLTKEELQDILDRWCDAVYAERVHSSTGQRPRERMAQPGFVPRTIKEEDLDILIMAEVGRTVCRGCVRYQGGRYFHEKLPEGCRVRLKVNDLDASAVLVYFKEKFLCSAVDLNRAGATPQQIKEAKRQRNKELRTGIKAREDFLTKYDISRAGAIAAIEMAERKKPAILPRKAKVVEFPNLSAQPAPEPEEEGEFFFKNAPEKFVFLRTKEFRKEVLTREERRFIQDFLEDEHYRLLIEQLDEKARREVA